VSQFGGDQLKNLWQQCTRNMWVSKLDVRHTRPNETS